MAYQTATYLSLFFALGVCLSDLPATPKLSCSLFPYASTHYNFPGVDILCINMSKNSLLVERAGLEPATPQQKLLSNQLSYLSFVKPASLTDGWF